MFGHVFLGLIVFEITISWNLFALLRGSIFGISSRVYCLIRLSGIVKLCFWCHALKLMPLVELSFLLLFYIFFIGSFCDWFTKDWKLNFFILNICTYWESYICTSYWESWYFFKIFVIALRLSFFPLFVVERIFFERITILEILFLGSFCKNFSNYFSCLEKEERQLSSFLF